MKDAIGESTDVPGNPTSRLGWKGPGRYLFRIEDRGATLSRRSCVNERAFHDAFRAASAAAGGECIEAVKTRRQDPATSLAKQLPKAVAAWSTRNISDPEEIDAWCDDPIWLVCDVCGQEWRTTPRAISRRPETQCTCTRCRKAKRAAEMHPEISVTCLNNGMRFESVSDAARWLASALPGNLSAGYLRVLVSQRHQSGEPVKGYRFVRDDNSPR